MIDLSISIVNTNNRDLLDKCLASIREATKKISYEIIVVDNFSTDGSAAMVRKKYPSVILIENSERLGFSANHNQALRRAAGRYSTILNEDTIIHTGCFDTMVEYMDAHPDTGALGPKILNPDGSLQQSVFRIPSLGLLACNAFFLGSVFPGVPSLSDYKTWPHDSESEVPFLGGACILFPSPLIRDIGYMDAGFFIYAEDPDVCLRVKKAGRRVVFLPSAAITHYGGGTFATTSDTSLNHRLTSTLRFFRKHYGAWSVPPAAALIISGALNHILVFSLLIPFLSEEKRDALKAKRNYFSRVLKWHVKRPGSGKR